MTVTGQDLVAEARSHVGQHEEPMGSNRGAFVQACQRATFLGGTGWPWCAAFECYVCAKRHVPLAYNGAAAHDLADHHKPWVSAAQAEPGMMVDFNIGSGHTGILVRLDVHTGTMETIDGNWGDQVSDVKTHRLSEIRGIWRVPGVHYSSGPAPHPKPPRHLPAWQVVTSAHGHKKVVARLKTKKGLIDWLRTHNVVRLFPNGITIRRGKR